MRSVCLALFLFIGSGIVGEVPANAQKPLSGSQLQQLLRAGMDSEHLANVVKERGVDFEVTGDSLVSLRQAGAEPVLLRSLGDAELRAKIIYPPYPLSIAQVPSYINKRYYSWPSEGRGFSPAACLRGVEWAFRP